MFLIRIIGRIVQGAFHVHDDDLVPLGDPLPGHRFHVVVEGRGHRIVGHAVDDPRQQDDRPRTEAVDFIQDVPHVVGAGGQGVRSDVKKDDIGGIGRQPAVHLGRHLIVAPAAVPFVVRIESRQCQLPVPQAADEIDDIPGILQGQIKRLPVTGSQFVGKGVEDAVGAVGDGIAKRHDADGRRKRILRKSGCRQNKDQNQR
jgi:hypothetical protein